MQSLSQARRGCSRRPAVIRVRPSSSFLGSLSGQSTVQSSVSLPLISLEANQVAASGTSTNRMQWGRPNGQCLPNQRPISSGVPQRVVRTRSERSRASEIARSMSGSSEIWSCFTVPSVAVASPAEMPDVTIASWCSPRRSWISIA